MSYDDESNVRIYMQEIARHKLLTGEEEVDLALKIRAGKAAAAALAADAGVDAAASNGKNGHGSHTLSPAERLRLQQLVDVAQVARRRLTDCNLRLVVNQAKRYAGVRGAQLLDLVQDGSIGLMQAVERFDPDMGNKFSTYAIWWIRHAIRRAIAEHTNGMRLPEHMMERYYEIVRVRQNLAQELGREPKVEEVALELSFSEIKEEDRLRMRAALQSGRKLTREDALVMKQATAKVQRLHTLAQDAVSLTSTIGPDDDNELIDTLEDVAALTGMDEAGKHMLEDLIDKILGHLDERERSVVELRFGFKDGQSRSLDEVGQMLNISRERVRQIETRTMRKLRHTNVIRSLREFYLN